MEGFIGLVRFKDFLALYEPEAPFIDDFGDDYSSLHTLLHHFYQIDETSFRDDVTKNLDRKNILSHFFSIEKVVDLKKKLISEYGNDLEMLSWAISKLVSNYNLFQLSTSSFRSDFIMSLLRLSRSGRKTKNKEVVAKKSIKIPEIVIERNYPPSQIPLFCEIFQVLERCISPEDDTDSFVRKVREIEYLEKIFWFINRDDELKTMFVEDFCHFFFLKIHNESKSTLKKELKTVGVDLEELMIFIYRKFYFSFGNLSVVDTIVFLKRNVEELESIFKLLFTNLPMIVFSSVNNFRSRNKNELRTFFYFSKDDRIKSNDVSLVVFIKEFISLEIFSKNINNSLDTLRIIIFDLVVSSMCDVFYTFCHHIHGTTTDEENKGSNFSLYFRKILLEVMNDHILVFNNNNKKEEEEEEEEENDIQKNKYSSSLSQISEKNKYYFLYFSSLLIESISTIPNERTDILVKQICTAGRNTNYFIDYSIPHVMFDLSKYLSCVHDTIKNLYSSSSTFPESIFEDWIINCLFVFSRSSVIDISNFNSIKIKSLNNLLKIHIFKISKLLIPKKNEQSTHNKKLETFIILLLNRMFKEYGFLFHDFLFSLDDSDDDDIVGFFKKNNLIRDLKMNQLIGFWEPKILSLNSILRKYVFLKSVSKYPSSSREWKNQVYLYFPNFKVDEGIQFLDKLINSDFCEGRTCCHPIFLENPEYWKKKLRLGVVKRLSNQQIEVEKVLENLKNVSQKLNELFRNEFLMDGDDDDNDKNKEEEEEEKDDFEWLNNDRRRLEKTASVGIMKFFDRPKNIVGEDNNFWKDEYFSGKRLEIIWKEKKEMFLLGDNF